MSSSETPEVLGTPEIGDAAARVCAWADRLQEWDRIADVRRVLQEALDRPGGTAEILIRLAELERDDDEPERAIELLTKVLGEHPGLRPAAGFPAELLLAEGRAEEAAEVITSVQGPVAGEFGELPGVIWRVPGRHALAVEAFDECASLSPRGRRLRRRSWWHSGGPFRPARRSVWLPPPAQELAGAPETSDALLEVVTWAEWLGGQDRRPEARQVLSDALAAHGRHPGLVR